VDLVNDDFHNMKTFVLVLFSEPDSRSPAVGKLSSHVELKSIVMAGLLVLLVSLRESQRSNVLRSSELNALNALLLMQGSDLQVVTTD